MSTTTTPTTRRTVLLGAALLTSLPLLATPKRANAAVPQATAKYQPMPKGAAQCSKCNYFIAGASATATGKCKVVAGDISPHGWCQLFAAKRA